MHASVVLLMALSGLGCQNEIPEAIDSPPAAYDTAASTFGSVNSGHTGPSGYSAYSSAFSSDFDASDKLGFGGALRDTIWSFFLGHSPGVASAREIEASVYGDQGGYSSYCPAAHIR